ncbi:hypothetical protein KAM643c_30780 [Aeromonas caviae]|nr:hypothetical protein KAM643c_30780 [Aeromonas caviae]
MIRSPSPQLVPFKLHLFGKQRPTNAIELLNSVLRKATKQRKLFPTDDSALKVAYLAIQQASKKWTMPIQNWKLALNRFIIEFGDRLNGHL